MFQPCAEPALLGVSCLTKTHLFLSQWMLPGVIVNRQTRMNFIRLNLSVPKNNRLSFPGVELQEVPGTHVWGRKSVIGGHFLSKAC